MPENNKEEFCETCGIVRRDGVIQPLCFPTVNGIHTWTTDDEPDLPSDLDMKTLLSAADAADIASLSADQKTERRRIFTRAMGRMLANASGASPAEKEAIEAGYREMLDAVMPSGGFSVNNQPLELLELPEPPKPPRSNFVFIKNSRQISVIDFKPLAAQFYRFIVSIDEPLSIVVHTDPSTSVLLTGPEAYKFLQYLRSLADYFDALANFIAAAQPNVRYVVPLSPSGGLTPTEQSAEIRELLTVPQIQALLDHADLLDTERNHPTNA